MATVTVTETGVVLQVILTRDELGVDRVTYNSASLTNIPEVQGRTVKDVPIILDAGQAAYIKTVLDFIQALAKSHWNIP